VLNFINLKQSKGNYIVDADGQTLLDLCGTELNPLGYNHDAFVKVIYTILQKLKKLHSKEFDSALINSNITTNEVASKEFQILVSKLFAPHAPHNLSAVTFTRGG
jgi:4-aminobutyrate aminotransferase-like enzyme